MSILTIETSEGRNNQHDLTHWHDRIEVLRVVSNSMYCVVNGTEHLSQAGDICIINRRQLHRIYCAPGSVCTFQRLMVDPSLFTADKVVY